MKKKNPQKSTRKNTFASNVVKELSALDGFAFRPMFGCVGMYAEGVFFGIICDDQLFFRANSKTLRRHLDHDCQPFMFKDRQRSNSYYSVPDSVIKNRAEFLKWARDAVRFRGK